MKEIQLAEGGSVPATSLCVQGGLQDAADGCSPAALGWGCVQARVQVALCVSLRWSSS